MVYCSVKGCGNGNHNRKGLGYFSIPRDRRRYLWLRFCRRQDSKFKEEEKKAKAREANNLRICSAHFTKSTYKNSLNGIRKLLKTANPSIRVPESPRNTPRKERCENRAVKRKLVFETVSCEHEKKTKTSDPEACQTNVPNVTEVNDLSPVSDDTFHCANSHKLDFENVQRDHCYFVSNNKPDASKQTEEEEEQTSCSVGCQTDMTFQDIENLEKQVKHLNIKLSNEKKLKRDLFMKDVFKSDESVKFYTGVPTVAVLNLLINTMKPESEKLKYWDKNKNRKMKYQNTSDGKPGRKRCLAVNEELILTLARLKLGLKGRHLADIFSISNSHVSRIFTTWVCFLASALKDSLVMWPSKEQIKENLPHSFKDYPNTRVVVDCTEIFIEKPTSPFAQKATWSEYKGHNTIKALVGISPSGYFTFLSKFWTGSSSDRKITQESGLVELLEEGDSVMADRGFNIRDILTKKKVYLNMPPFSKKGKQLSRTATRTTRQIAQVRIHVERAIERLKDFSIFDGNLPLTLAPLADNILVVCGALCNLLKPLTR